MTKVLFDTNIILDIALKRIPYFDDSARPARSLYWTNLRLVKGIDRFFDDVLCSMKISDMLTRMKGSSEHIPERGIILLMTGFA